MPTKTQGLLGAVASLGIAAGGAWLASGIHSSQDAVNSSARHGQELSVTVSGIEKAQGTIVVIVFDDRDAFQSYDIAKAAGYREVEARGGTQSIDFPHLKNGPYAVAAYHDENGDRDFTMDDGVPLEGYATSGALDPYDVPSFRQASVPGGSITIEMHYPE